MKQIRCTRLRSFQERLSVALLYLEIDRVRRRIGAGGEAEAVRSCGVTLEAEVVNVAAERSVVAEDPSFRVRAMERERSHG